MITNELLEMKYKVQKALSEQAGHDMSEYVKMSHRIIQEIEAKYGIRFKYGSGPVTADDAGEKPIAVQSNGAAETGNISATSKPGKT